MRLKGLLLDFGGVVLMTPFELLGRAEANHGLEAGSLGWKGPFDPGDDPAWRDLQEGRIDEPRYWQDRAREFRAIVGGPGELRELMSDLFGGPESEFIRSGAVQLVREAHQAGLLVGVFSNDLELFHGRDWMERVSFLDSVDALIDMSYLEGRKPEPIAYRLALDALGLSAEEVLLLDDQPRNVAGARAAALKAIAFDVTDPQASFAACRRCLGLGPSLS